MSKYKIYNQIYIKCTRVLSFTVVFKAVLRIRIRLDPFHLVQPDPNPGIKKSAKIMENFHKKQPKS